jgi:hypothetical protein
VDDSVLVPGERDEVDAVFLAVQCFVRAGKMQLRSEIFCIAVRNTENSRGLLRVVQLDAFIFGTGDDVLSTGSDVHVVDPVIIIRKGFCHFEGFHQLLSKCNHSLRFQIWQLIRGEELKQKLFHSPLCFQVRWKCNQSPFGSIPFQPGTSQRCTWEFYIPLG